MQFRLTYQGSLLSEARWRDKDKDRPLLATNKQYIRKNFHPQLRNLWSLQPALTKSRNATEVNAEPQTERRTRVFGTLGSNHSIPALSTEFSRYGFNFVPLLTKKLQVLCELEVLLLRPGKQGMLFNAGDIDNRLKTLFDALSMPQFESQLGEHLAPMEDEHPFFCLLEDDSLISKVVVEADTLLEPVAHPDEDARAIITVRTRPYVITAANVAFT